MAVEKEGLEKRLRTLRLEEMGMWRRIAGVMGKTDIGCKNKAKQIGLN